MSNEDRGRASRTIDRDQPCQNCGDPTPGEYCPTCGQRKVEVRVSIRTLLMDVLEDQFILDKRLPRTLGALLFRPGQMTAEHVNGRMVRYIHPFRLYLVTSLIFFLLLSVHSLRLVRQAGESGVESVVAVSDSLDAEIADIDSALAAIDRELADTARPAALRASLQATRSDLEQRRARLAIGRDTLAALVPTVVSPDSAAAVGGDGAGEPNTLNVAFSWDEDPPTLSTGIAAVDSTLARQVRRFGEMEPGEAAETLVGTFFNYAPTMMFILLPLFAAVLKLLYIRRRRFYAEHFVFLLHVHSFVFILASVGLVLGGWAGNWLEGLLWIWMLVYIYLAMRRVYGQGRLKTLAKYWILGLMYFLILIAGIPVALLVAVFLA